jgi:hypothetical protein
MTTVYIFSGLPYSGKSFYIEQYIKPFVNDFKHLQLSTYLKEKVDNPSNVLYNVFCEEIKNYNILFVEGWFLDPIDLINYKERCEQYGFKISEKRFHINIETAIQRYNNDPYKYLDINKLRLLYRYHEQKSQNHS